METLEKPIESAEDLAAQTKIQYGTVSGGSTEGFFLKATLEPFKTMGEYLESEWKEEI